MKIGYKLYFMSEKTKKNATNIYPILDFATQRSVFYLCKTLFLCGTA